MEEAYMRESTRKVFSLAEDIFLAAQLRLLFPLGTTSQNNIQKSFIRQKDPAMEKKNILAGQCGENGKKMNETVDRVCYEFHH